MAGVDCPDSPPAHRYPHGLRYSRYATADVHRPPDAAPRVKPRPARPHRGCFQGWPPAWQAGHRSDPRAAALAGQYSRNASHHVRPCRENQARAPSCPPHGSADHDECCLPRWTLRQTTDLLRRLPLSPANDQRPDAAAARHARSYALPDACHPKPAGLTGGGRLHSRHGPARSDKEK